MPLLALFQDLGRDVVGRATEGASPVLRVLLVRDQEGSEAKVADLDVHMLVEEDVPHLQISVDDVLVMHVFDGAAGLDEIRAHLWLREVPSPPDHVHHGPVVAETKDDVGALGKREGAVELDDVGVMHLRVNLEFCLELFGRSASEPI